MPQTRGTYIQNITAYQHKENTANLPFGSDYLFQSRPVHAPQGYKRCNVLVISYVNGVEHALIVKESSSTCMMFRFIEKKKKRNKHKKESLRNSSKATLSKLHAFTCSLVAPLGYDYTHQPSLAAVSLKCASVKTVIWTSPLGLKIDSLPSW